MHSEIFALWGLKAADFDDFLRFLPKINLCETKMIKLLFTGYSLYFTLQSAEYLISFRNKSTAFLFTQHFSAI